MIADATFLRRRHRQLFISMAEKAGVQVGIVDCRAGEETLRRNIRHRSAEGKDASDADLAVLEHQLRHHDPLDETERRLVVPPGPL
jgi:predicted kinase